MANRGKVIIMTKLSVYLLSLGAKIGALLNQDYRPELFVVFEEVHSCHCTNSGLQAGQPAYQGPGLDWGRLPGPMEGQDTPERAVRQPSNKD